MIWRHRTFILAMATMGCGLLLGCPDDGPAPGLANLDATTAETTDSGGTNDAVEPDTPNSPDAVPDASAPDVGAETSAPDIAVDTQATDVANETADDVAVDGAGDSTSVNDVPVIDDGSAGDTTADPGGADGIQGDGSASDSATVDAPTQDTPAADTAPDVAVDAGTPDVATDPGTPDIPTDPGTPDIPTDPGTPDVGAGGCPDDPSCFAPAPGAADAPLNLQSGAAPNLAGGAAPDGWYQLESIDLYADGTFNGFVSNLSVSSLGNTFGSAEMQAGEWGVSVNLNMNISMNVFLVGPVNEDVDLALTGGGCFSVSDNQLNVPDFLQCGGTWVEGQSPPTVFDYETGSGTVSIMIVLSEAMITSLLPADLQGSAGLALSGDLPLVMNFSVP